MELYKLSISLQGSFTAGITGLGEDIGTVAAGIVQSLQDAATWQEAATSGVLVESEVSAARFYDLSLDPHGLCGNQSVLCELKTGWDPADPDCSREPLFIQCAQGDILMDLLAGASR